jgi:hypothetical protein
VIKRVKKVRSGTLIAFILIAYLSMIVIAQASLALEPPKRLLPSPQCTAGWTIEGDGKTYTKNDLYTYINGEAELYFPYGFRSLVSGTYINNDDLRIALVADIYEMGSVLDAFGMFANYRKQGAEEADIGGGSFITGSQLMFYQGRYFVQISASGTSTLDRSLFLNCAKAVAQQLTDKPFKPEELSLLQILAFIPKTERYIPQGVLGYAFFRKGMIGRAQIDSKEVRVFVIIEDSAQTAAEAFKHYQTYLLEAGVQSEQTKQPQTIYARDPLHKGLLLKQADRYLIGVADLVDPSQGKDLIEQLQKRLPVPEIQR